jgi:hypothetical protein
MSTVLIEATVARPMIAKMVNGSALARGTGETAAKRIIVIAMINARFFIAFSLSCLNWSNKPNRSIFLCLQFEAARKGQQRVTTNRHHVHGGNGLVMR